jgi:hypothetical protein
VFHEAVVKAVGSILEGYEAGEDPFVDAVVELPAGSTVAAALPVVEPLAQSADEEDAEPGWEVSALIDQAELPRGLHEKRKAVFVVMVGEPQTCAVQNVGADRLDILELMELQLPG